MKAIIRIFNVIYMALSVVAVCCLLFVPFLNTSVGYTVKPETLQKIVPLEEYGIKYEDYVEVLGAEGKQITIDVKVEPKQLGEVVFKNSGQQMFENLISENASKITTEIIPAIEQLGRKIAINQCKTPLSTGIDTVIKNTGSDHGVIITDEKLAEIKGKAGIDDAYITTLSGKLMDATFAAGATTANLKELMRTEINTIFVKLAEADPMFKDPFTEEPFTISDANLNTVMEKIVSALQNSYIVKSDGITIRSIDSVMAIFIHNINASTPFSGDGDLVLVDEVTSALLVVVAPFSSTIVLGLQITAYVLGFMILGWVVFFIITLIKTLTKKPWTHTWLVFWINAIVQIVLGVLLYVVVLLLNSNVKDTIIGWIPQASNVLNSININYLKTSAFIPSIIVLVMIVTFFIYGSFKRKAKKKELMNK